MPLYYAYEFWFTILHFISILISWFDCHCLTRLLVWMLNFYILSWSRNVAPSLRRWAHTPTVHFYNAAGHGNAASIRRRGRSRKLFGVRVVLAEVFQYLDRADLDASQLVCKEFRDVVDDFAAMLPVYGMKVTLRPVQLLVEYTAQVDGIGSVTGYVFNGLRSHDKRFFRNVNIRLKVSHASCTWTNAEIMSALLNKTALQEMNASLTALKCEASASELNDVFDYVKRYSIRSLAVHYRPSLITPNTRFITSLFAKARKQRLETLKLSCCNQCPDSCEAETQVGQQLLQEIIAEQRHTSADRLSIVIPHFKSFHFLRKVVEFYSRGEVTRPLTVGCHSDVSLAEIWPCHIRYFRVTPNVHWRVPLGQKLLHMTMKTGEVHTFYNFQLAA